MKNWENICTLSLVHFMAFPEMQSGEGDFIGSLHQIVDRNFFRAIEMGLINDPATRAKVKKTAQDHAIKIGFGAQPLILGQNLNLNHLVNSTRSVAVECIKSAIEQAYQIGADRFVLLSGKDPGGDSREDAYSALEESLVELGTFARPLGIRIVLETFDRAVDKRALVGPSDEAVLLAKRVQNRYPEFGLLYDMGHMPLLGETPAQGLSALKDVLVEVHLGNCVTVPGLTAFGDKHPRFDFEGGVNGTKELVEFLKELFHIGYLRESPGAGEIPWVGFEMRPFNGETTSQILDNIENTWRTAWERL